MALKCDILTYGLQEDIWYLVHEESYIGRGPGELDWFWSYARGLVVQLGVAPYSMTEPIKVNVRVLALGQKEHPPETAWPFVAKLIVVHQPTPRSQLRIRAYKELLYGEYDPASRRGQLLVHRDIDLDSYVSRNVPVWDTIPRPRLFAY